MKMLSRIAFAAGLALLVSVGVQPVWAACASSDLIDATGDTVGQAGSCIYCASDQPNVSLNVQGAFWGLGTGDPAPGSGDDNGLWTAENWLQRAGFYQYGDGSYYNYYVALFTNWAAAGVIDGCWTNSGTNCMCLFLADTWDDKSYVAIFGQSPVSSNFTLTSGVVMNPMPKPVITNAVRNALDIDVTVSLESVAGNLNILDGSCGGCAPSGWKLYKREVPTDTTPAADRNRATWLNVATVGSTGGNTTINLDCTGGATDVYLAASLVWSDGFETGVVSRNSTKVACDPDYAEPKPIERPDRPNKPIRQRPVGQRGR